MIKNNQHKYSISAMCKVLQIPRSTYYYEAKERATEDDITSDVIDVFQASRQNYGTLGYVSPIDYKLEHFEKVV